MRQSLKVSFWLNQLKHHCTYKRYLNINMKLAEWKYYIPIQLILVKKYIALENRCSKLFMLYAKLVAHQ